MARRLMLVVVLASLAGALTTAPIPGASPRTAGASPLASALPAGPPYVAPVDGVIVDHFRPPASIYAAGNRGIDEVTAPGAPVVASAAGVVIFAGTVGGTLHITIRHADGLRTSYSFLAGVFVHEGDSLEQGQLIGLSAGAFHFGVRDIDGTYLDPEALLAGDVGSHLVPGVDEGAAPLSPDDERRGFEQLIAAGSSIVVDGVTRLAAMAEEAQTLQPGWDLFELSMELEHWRRAQEHCTPRDAPVPTPSVRHIAILVGGLGSTSESAAVDHVDLAGLGYAASDVVRLSYRGGRVPRTGAAASGPLEALPATSYRPIDTEDDLHQSADRLRDLLDEVARNQPGVPIDVIAHSQGGVVVRLALAASGDDGQMPADLGTVVTLGTPHQGADLATAVAAFGPRTPTGSLVGRVGEAAGVDLDPAGLSIAQLSQTSEVSAELARPVPAGVRLLSIGASGDLTVPAVRTEAPGADSVVVHLGGLHAHDQLPRDPATTREIGLALAGRAPTCSGLVQGVSDVVTSHVITRAEDGVGLALAGHPY
jgi:hypothetical protein